MIVSVFRVFCEDPVELSNDSSARVYVPSAAAVVSIETVAEDAPFAMLTNDSGETLFCLRLIYEPHRLLIAEDKSPTDIVFMFPLMSIIELSMATLRSYVGTIIEIVSVLRASVGIELFVSTDSSTREYVPPGIPIA